MQIKTLFVFDIDDTLTISAKLHQDVFIVALKKIGVNQIDTNFGEYKHHTDSYIARIIYESDKGESFDESKQKQFEKILHEELIKYPIQEIKGAKTVIDQIESNSNYGLCFATGSLLKPAQFKLDQIGLEGYQSRLTASNHIEKREGIVRSAIKKAKKFYNQDHFNRIISVGDGLWDLKTAKALGIEFIGVGLRNKQTLEDNGAITLFDDLSNFPLKN